jgi:hypothetical protein
MQGGNKWRTRQIMTAIKVKLQSTGESPGTGKIVSFTLYDKHFTVREILDIWHGRDHVYYKLIAEDNILYILKHDLETDTWELVEMDVYPG